SCLLLARLTHCSYLQGKKKCIQYHLLIYGNHKSLLRLLWYHFSLSFHCTQVTMLKNKETSFWTVHTLELPLRHALSRDPGARARNHHLYLIRPHRDLSPSRSFS